MFKTSLIAALLIGFTHTSLAESTGMSAGDRAKLAKERAKSSAAFGKLSSAGGDGGAGADDTPCSLDIGNIDTGGRGRAPREVNVFITGDVIQANRNCR